MIHTLLSLTRPLFCFDCETTGLNTETARIVELGFQQWDAEGMTKEYRTLVNPLVPIPQAVIDVHGITDAIVTGCRECDRPLALHRGDAMLPGAPTRSCEGFKPWPTFKQIAVSLAGGFRDCDYAGKNVRFDLRILAAEMKRARQAWSYAGARIIDADRLEQLAVPRHLSDLHKKYTGKEHDGAHGALSDVRASTNVIVGQLGMWGVLPRDLDQLHELSWPGWLTTDGGVRLVNGVATIMFGKHRDKALRDVPGDYFDWILKNDFADDMKKIASEAKMGRYPGA